jgi:hypothetical protein
VCHAGRVWEKKAEKRGSTTAAKDKEWIKERSRRSVSRRKFSKRWHFLVWLYVTNYFIPSIQIGTTILEREKHQEKEGMSWQLAARCYSAGTDGEK